jgi:AcrR family transcriptional regulator
MIAATAAVMRRRGYLGTRYLDVSQAARVPMSSLQYHFHSIEELRREALCHLILYRAEVMHERIQQAGSPWARIEAVIDETCSSFDAEDVPTWFLWLEQRQGGRDHPAIEKARAHARQVFVEDVSAAIRDGLQSGEFTIDAPIRELLREIAAIISGLLDQIYDVGDAANQSGTDSEDLELPARIARRGVWRALHCTSPGLRVPESRAAADVQVPAQDRGQTP